MIEWHAPPLGSGGRIERVHLIARDNEYCVANDNGRPLRFDLARPHLGAVRAPQRNNLLGLQRNIDALGVHRAASCWRIFERGDPFLRRRQQRQWNRLEFFCFGFSAQTHARHHNRGEQKKRKCRRARAAKHYSLCVIIAPFVSHQTILVLDFGSQYTQLIARRLRELSVYSEIVPFNTPIDKLKEKNPVGIILSGGPSSVSDPGAPACDPRLFDLGTPVLGICYGMQLMTDVLGGEVRRSGQREFGHANVRVTGNGAPPRLFTQVPGELRVWASHGDDVNAVPPGFHVAATSATAPIAAMEAPDRQLYALLFHPEVAHTEHGLAILRNFAYGVCGCTGDWTIASFIEEATERITRQVGGGKVVCGLSGGVDSTVAAMLLHRAIGDRLTCIFVDNGLLRYDEANQIVKRFREKMQLPLEFVDASSTFLERLAGVTDPEQKRKIIGATFIDVFERRANELGDFDFLAQGTLYPDVIESASVHGPAVVIKSHHNVGGLPERMKFALVEPLRDLFKDEVRTS